MAKFDYTNAPRIVEPHQLGWLRRPELDTDTVDVWERADGQLHAQWKGKWREFAFYKGVGCVGP